MTEHNATNPLTHLSLGKVSEYIDQYTPDLLQAVPRSMNRQALGCVDNQPFHGVDIWNGYELSWLNLKGKPCVALMQVEIPASSPNLIESKSFKLYLNSFNQWKIGGRDELQATLSRDLSHCAGEKVKVRLHDLGATKDYQIQHYQADLLDDLDIEVSEYQPNPQLLVCTNKLVERSHISHLLKSNCLITSQPDWASVLIRYSGNEIQPESLLRYLISFRQHNEFHEQCVERIFCDILQQCQPQNLTVYARYTRRGGLDINPFRSNFESPYANFRLIRQ
ncbi:NADPH-dependent 7-cyano-7-deazaguanine reductase QueF [Bowmanella denitrificans]|uniref:NADPH-dependent 7-cyano-7-deazaguanine reductase QueF n=1 Tax=Bowmanella denitrificans TaxID=366582 RepID=UPI001C0E94D6|nr:NADPH-dependent 7-cyano-7-deazaguanine reductase QueF [Bowmanella denitrificans]